MWALYFYITEIYNILPFGFGNTVSTRALLKLNRHGSDLKIYKSAEQPHLTYSIHAISMRQERQ